LNRDIKSHYLFEIATEVANRGTSLPDRGRPLVHQPMMLTARPST
jgi:hypothetical protein